MKNFPAYILRVTEDEKFVGLCFVISGRRCWPILSKSRKIKILPAYTFQVKEDKEFAVVLCDCAR
jgi:hypothetical protein